MSTAPSRRIGGVELHLHAFLISALHGGDRTPDYPLDRRLCGLQSRSGHGDEEKNSQPPSGLEPPIIQPVAQRYTTELFQLLSGLGTAEKKIPLLPQPGI
jgi:hypothetical protein